MSELIRAKEVKLAELLRQGCFNVPRHQRYYDWKIEHVNALLDDLAEAVNENSPCHFLGSIMLIKNGADPENKWEINDGQQRIITFSLMCAYLCKTFHSKGCSFEENSILRVLFDIQEAHSNTLNDADKLIPRITPPINNKTNFNNLIRGHGVGANGKMIHAWNSITAFFQTAENKKVNRLKKIMDFMLHKIIVIQLEIDESLDSNAIFETLNYRGKSLEQIDLIKNYFLQSFNTESEVARGKTTHSNFEYIHTSFNRNEEVSEYIRCFMQAKYGFINKEQFLKSTKKRFNGLKKGKADQIFSLVSALAEKEKIHIYKTFLRKSANQEFIQKLTQDARKTNNNRKIEDYLRDLHEYTITRPILFSLFCCYDIDSSPNKRRMSAKFVYDCTKILSSFMQRLSHVGPVRPSAYEEKFATLAMLIFARGCTTAQDFFDLIKEHDNSRIIDDANYIEQVGTKYYPRGSHNKTGYILKKIEEYKQHIKIVDSHVSVEHILPKARIHNAKPSWVSDFSSSDCDRLVHCLGNLTLLNKKENSPTEKDNESFSAKKKVYKNSSFELTKDICTHSEWTPQIVKKRQYKLAKIAAKNIWNFRL